MALILFGDCLLNVDLVGLLMYLNEVKSKNGLFWANLVINEPMNKMNQ